MELVDTHCHIHEALMPDSEGTVTQRLWAKAGSPEPDNIIKSAADDGVAKLICVGTTQQDSELAVNFVRDRPNCWASIGIHPHEAKDHQSQTVWEKFAELAVKPKVVAVGECGLDYYYENSPKEDQKLVLRRQIEFALEHDLPMIFHIRDAFADFWKILDDYKNIRGVVHSFSATQAELDQVLKRDLYVGLNGIMTFTKSDDQLAAAKLVPSNRLLLETDAPFLTPAPYRGTICEPKHVRVTADFLARLRGESITEIAHSSTSNAEQLFNLND